MNTNRYEIIEDSRPESGGAAALGRDRWTGRDVVLKRAETAAALLEARCLLVLPTGVGPYFIDLLEGEPGELTLVLERLEGRTLREAAGDLEPGQIPPLARAICQRLADAHRTGWLHMDVKPENILVTETEDGAGARLLDFGFAIDLFGGFGAGERGGTPPYTAPEVRKGWIVGGRADLFSFGVVLEQILKGSGGDARWQPILDTLLQDVPGNRPASAIALRDEITRVFGLAQDPQRFPRFGAGPIRGRAAEIALIRRLARPGARILVQARPGIGLSRFLREASVRLASDGMSARTVDLGEIRSPEGIDRAFDLLETAASAEEIVLCGIPDPSPGLHWMAPSTRGRLRGILSQPGWERFALRPLDAEAYREIVIASLGMIDAVAEGIARTLFERTEGDLPKAAEGFARAVRHAGKESDLKWKLDRVVAQEALAVWRPGPIPPTLAETPSSLRKAIGIYARVGRSFPVALTRDLARAFGQEAELEALQDHGILVSHETDRLEFVTAELWREAATAPPASNERIDLWLIEHFDPSLERIDDVLQACRIARRSGNGARESELLGKALLRAIPQRRHGDILAMLAHPEKTPPVWTVETALRDLGRLKTILGPGWNENWLLAVAAAAIRTVDVPLGVQLTERAANTGDPKAAALALVTLVERVAPAAGNPTFDRYLTALRELEGVPDGAPPGVSDYFLAVRGYAEGRITEAHAYVAAAARKLRGSGHICEAISEQASAVVQFTHAPAEAIAAMRAALEAALDPETEAQILNNLALMYDLTGSPELGLECTEPAIPRLRGRATPARIAYLETQMCCELTLLDRVDRAREEILSLISLPSNRFMFRRLVPLRGTLGLCHLHRGNMMESLRQSAQAIAEAAESGQPAQFWSVAGDMTDILVDLDDNGRIHEHVPMLRRPPSPDIPETAVVAARVEALQCYADGHLDEGAALLEAQLPEAPGLHRPLVHAHLLHQIGSIRLAQGLATGDRAALERARAAIEEELVTLPETAYGYYRARAKVALGRLLDAMGERDRALETLSQAVDLAREIKSLRLLALALEARARADMRPL